MAARVVTSTLAKIPRMCVDTVHTLMPSTTAMVLFVWPLAVSLVISLAQAERFALNVGSRQRQQTSHPSTTTSQPRRRRHHRHRQAGPGVQVPGRVRRGSWARTASSESSTSVARAAPMVITPPSAHLPRVPGGFRRGRIGAAQVSDAVIIITPTTTSSRAVRRQLRRRGPPVPQGMTGHEPMFGDGPCSARARRAAADAAGRSVA
jgi:hypothetical protein